MTARTGDVIETDCWIWQGATTPNGYGSIREGRNSRVAHRAIYEVVVGPIPEGLVLDHLCRVRNCVNPDHLEPVTNKANILRGTGFAARNAKKTHCPAGHPLSGDNAYEDPKKPGTRSCRACHREAARRYRDRLPEMACGQCGRTVSRGNESRHRKMHERTGK